MNGFVTRTALVAGAACWLAASMPAATAADAQFSQELLSIQHEWAHANYQVSDKKERRAAFEALVKHSAAFAERFPTQVEAVAWDGIVLSTYAGEVGALSAMKYAKAAREQLMAAESLNAEALSGGIYASLGALYSKVPGGLMGFGDDELAEVYFKKALAVDSGNIDNNYFYGEFLLAQGRSAEALGVLRHALESPPVTTRPVFDAGRRSEIRTLIGQAEQLES
jgi:tetratricopeptide (TPR) repeat protein